VTEDWGFGRLCTTPEKAGIQRRVRIQNAQLTAAKVSNSILRGKVRKFPRHFKGHFSNGNVQVRIFPRSPGILVFREFPCFDEKGPQNAGFSHRRLSLATDSRTFWVENPQKSPAEFNQTPVFWRLASETEE
jgi:hypothetical protein